MTTTAMGSMTFEQTFTAFKFYEEAAEKAKAHAWSQTTWLLAINTGLFAFSVNFYAQHRNLPGFLLIEFITAGVGVVLCAFLLYLLDELGGHISHYWTTSNKLAAENPPLVGFISAKDALAVREPGYHAPFPPFCRRLQCLAGLFLAAHLGWAVVVAYLGRA